MAHVITFRTARFDVSLEPRNPVNPIAGHGVLAWLRDELARTGYEATEPATEDWGWYIDVVRADASYLVGASADADDSEPNIEWTLQIHRTRTLKDKLFGRNTMTAADPLSSIIERTLRSEPAVEVLSVEREDK